MKRIIVFIMVLICLCSCTLLEPSRLIIENSSEYDIKINFENAQKNYLILESGKGEFVMVYPPEINFTVRIKSINYKEDFNLKIKYLEIKKFIFNLNE